MVIFSPRAEFFHHHTKTEKPLNKAEEYLQKRYVPELRYNRPKMDDFKNEPGYSADQINADKMKLKGKKSGYHEADKHERAEILEALLYHVIETGNWFGEHACTVVSSEYDDEFHGTDFIIEFDINGDGSRIARLAIDVTTAKDKDTIAKKWERISTPLMKRGEFTKLDYFESAVDGTRGRAEMPHIILGIDADNFDLVAQEIEKSLTSHNPQELGEHFLKYELLDLAYKELKLLTEITERKVPQNHRAKAQEDLRVLIDEIAKSFGENKKLSKHLRRFGSRNEVYANLKDVLEKAA
jgi:hypothetical protein